MRDTRERPDGRWHLSFLVILVVVLACIIGWQARDFNRPPDTPAAVAYWGEIGRRGQLATGDNAPDFCLTNLDGGGETHLHDLRSKLVVLLFGSYSCPNFRSHASAINHLYSAFEDKAEFYFVYIREAHCCEDGQIPENNGVAPIYRARSLEERAITAALCAAELDIEMQVLVDDLDELVTNKYRAWPEGAYVIDGNGRIAHANRGNINTRAIAETLNSLF